MSVVSVVISPVSFLTLIICTHFLSLLLQVCQFYWPFQGTNFCFSDFSPFFVFYFIDFYSQHYFILSACILFNFALLFLDPWGRNLYIYLIHFLSLMYVFIVINFLLSADLSASFKFLYVLFLFSSVSFLWSYVTNVMSSLISLWSENKLCKISTVLNLFYGLFILAYKKNVYWHLKRMGILLLLSGELYKCSLVPIVFWLAVLSILEIGMLSLYLLL